MAAPKKRKLTTREPKRILKRKPARKKTAAAKKTAAKKTASAKSATRSTAVDRKAEDLKMTEKLKSYQDKGLSLKDASDKLGIRPAKARRLLQVSGVRPKDKIVGTDKDVAAKIKKARDDEGVSWGVLRARTGMTTRKVKAMYASAGGKSTGAKRTASKTAAKPTTRKAKTNTRTTAKAKSTTKAASKTKATARAPRTRKTKATKEVATTAESSGLTSRQRRRASKNAESKKRLNTLWDLDSTDKQVTAAIEGQTLVVTRNMNGHAIAPTEHTVGTIKEIGISNREGRVIHFLDENLQNRVVTAREVTDLK